jgi:hypothetical protein
MKKVNIVLTILLLSFLSFAISGCQGGNPFNFFIGKVGKSVDKETPTPAVDPSVLVMKDSLETEEESPPKTDKDSLRILEKALGLEYFYYSSGGRRDPFETLFKGRELNVENVKLVGTIWGPKGRFALLKEPGGTGFVVGIGDKIADGRVIDITSNSVSFKITRFGVTSKVTLMLEEEEETIN